MSEIKNPTHYTNHPSGVKCKEITMCLSNGAANAVKYVWRSADKHESPKIDILKAIEYLGFELEAFDNEILKNRQRVICQEYQVGTVTALIERVIQADSNRRAAQFYRLVRNAVQSRSNAGRVVALEKAIELLRFYVSDIRSAEMVSVGGDDADNR